MESSPAVSGGSFRFVEHLARELSRGNLEVPGFPDVVLRIRRQLDDPGCDASSIAKVISGEPVLTAKLIRMVNSAALKPAAGEIRDPRSAIARLGFTLVHSATVSFAAEQMRHAQKYESMRDRFDDIWRRSTDVAAIAYVLARRCCRRLNPDEALLTGLLHSIGKLYILSRAQDHPELFETEQQLDTVLADWYVQTSESILQSWNFPDEIVRAVAAQLDADREPGEQPTLADVLHVALPLPAVLGLPEDMVPVLEATKAGVRLGLTTEQCLEVLTEAAEQIDELRGTLRD
jgi:HD-like signal output (HDOD) protein